MRLLNVLLPKTEFVLYGIMILYDKELLFFMDQEVVRQISWFNEVVC